MSVPVLTFFNNKGGVGKTSLVYHLSWIFSEMGKKVIAIDLDPQANLTSAFLPEAKLEELWDADLMESKASTIYQCVRPLMEVGDIQEPITQRIRSSLHLVPGDLAGLPPVNLPLLLHVVQRQVGIILKHPDLPEFFRTDPARGDVVRAVSAQPAQR
ncbi:MAG: ParA family protein, partial [Terrimicrobiaceae bacterium]